MPEFHFKLPKNNPIARLPHWRSAFTVWVPKNEALAGRLGCAVFLGRADFPDFSVGRACGWCYRIDVAVIVISCGGAPEQHKKTGGMAGRWDHDVVNPYGSRKTQGKT